MELLSKFRREKLYPSYFFQACLYWSHRAVIFTIARFFCYYSDGCYAGLRER